MLLEVLHPVLQDSEKTYLNAISAVGATTLTVLSNSVFAANDYIVLGKLGVDRTEIRKLATVTGTDTVTMDAAVYDHPLNSEVTKIRYNKIKVYRSSTETGTFTEISGSPFSIQADKDYTTVDDPAGTASSWYEIAFLNTTTSSESGLSDPIQGSGMKRGSVRQLINLVRFAMDLPDDNVAADSDIIALFNSCIDDIQSSKDYIPSQKSATIVSVIGQSEYDLPTDLMTIRSLKVWRGSTPYTPTETSIDELDLWATATTSSVPDKWSTWGTKLVFSAPFTDITSDIKVRYLATIPYVTSDNDVLLLDNPNVAMAYACMIISSTQINTPKKTDWAGIYAQLKNDMLKQFRSIRHNTGHPVVKTREQLIARRSLRDIIIGPPIP